MEDFLTFLFVCIVGGVVGLPAFIILLFWARPERWTFKSFCLWLATWVSWGCCPPLYVWIERRWQRASWKRCSYALLSPISLISLIYVCSFVSDIVNKPYGSRMEISYKVGVGLPAYEVIDRTYGKKSFTLDYMDRIDIKFEPGRETERFYWWMKTNPPAHWSVSEDGGFYFNEISEDGTFFTMRIDPQKGTARIEYGAW